MVTPQSLLLHSPPGILGTHAHAPGVSFKPLGPGREPRSTTWEFSDINITLTTGSLDFRAFLISDFQITSAQPELPLLFLHFGLVLLFSAMVVLLLLLISNITITLIQLLQIHIYLSAYIDMKVCLGS